MSAQKKCATWYLIQNLKSIQSEARLLAKDVHRVGRLLVLLDSLPSSDSVVPDDMLAKINAEKTKSTLAIWLTGGRPAPGEIEARYQSPMAAQRLAVLSLLDNFVSNRDKPTTTPVDQRREQLGGLWQGISALSQKVILMHKSVEALALPDSFSKDLSALEVELAAIGNEVLNWQNHPSERMGANMAACAKKVETLLFNIRVINRKALSEATA